MPHRRLVLHHYDPTAHRAGGIETCIRDMVRFGHQARFGFIASDLNGDRPIGQWQRLDAFNASVRSPVLFVSRLDVARGLLPDVVGFGAACLRFRGAIRAAEPDVVQVHRPELALLALRLFPDLPLVLFVHEDAANWRTSTTESHWRRFPDAYLALQGRAVRSADRVVSFSHSAAERLAADSDRVIEFPTWFDPSSFKQREIADADPTAVLWVGRLEAVKDPFLALETLACLPDDFTMSMVGHGRLHGALEAEIAQQGLTSRVRLVGHVSTSEVAELMRRHRTLLMTSHSEGFPRALVEMLATGRPVVATEAADPGALLTEPAVGARTPDRDGGVLAELILRSLDNADVDLCCARVAHLGAPTIVGQILDADG